MMNPAILYLVFAAIVAIDSTVSAQPEGTCQACNCQFNNVQVLSQLIESKIASVAVTGVTYTRWGKTSCPNNTDAELVYSGRAGGTNYNTQGGSAERICLPDDPDYVPESIDISPSGARSYRNVIQGVEYEVNYGIPGNPLTDVHQHNAPCAVCFVPTRSTTIMIPAKSVCPSDWTREYYGFLMSSHDGHHRTSYTCLDIDPEPVPGTGSSTNPSLFYHSVTDCHGLSCPPYENNRMLSCVVCTK